MNSAQLSQLGDRVQFFFHSLLQKIPQGKILRPTIVTTALTFIVLILWFLVCLFESRPGEIAGALGSFIGGLIGAGAAVGAVFVLIWRQTKDEAEKVSEAVKIEITTLAKYVIGATEICQKIKLGEVQIPRQDAHYIVKNFANDPVIYPAVADRIGLLSHPQATTEFYMRLVEARVMVEMLQKKTTPQGIMHTSPSPDYVTADFAGSVADSLLTALQLARPIIANEPEAPHLMLSVGQVVTRQLDECLRSAKRSFPDAESFKNQQA
jgi:hypothetical protein